MILLRRINRWIFSVLLSALQALEVFKQLRHTRAQAEALIEIDGSYNDEADQPGTKISYYEHVSVCPGILLL